MSKKAPFTSDERKTRHNDRQRARYRADRDAAKKLVDANYYKINMGLLAHVIAGALEDAYIRGHVDAQPGDGEGI